MGDSVLWHNFSLNCYQFPSPTAILCFYIFVFPNHQLLSQHFTSKDKGTSLFLCLHYSAKSLPSCLTPRDPMNCGPPGASVLGILQARILEWVAMPSSRGSSPPRHRTCVSCISRQILYLWCHLGSPCISIAALQIDSSVLSFCIPYTWGNMQSFSF